MNDRDCESCKKFSRNDPHESEGYCHAKRTWVDPQEGEDCKMHEFTLHSATKYKDGTPIMSEPEKVYCETDSALIHGETDTYATRKAAKNSMYGKTAEEVSNQLDTEYCLNGCDAYNKYCDHTLEDKRTCPYLPHTPEANIRYLEQAFTEFAKTQDDLIAEYDETLKTHGDTLEQHMERIEDTDTVLAKHAYKINKHTDTLEEHLERICDLERMYESVLDDLYAMRERLCKITDLLVGQNAHAHIFSNFCGNCIHAEMKDGICACELSGEIVDPDSASCSLFDPSYTSNPEWFENMKKTMTTPAEPTAGCKGCNCAKDGMCTKYNCSLGAICPTPECFELPF